VEDSDENPDAERDRHRAGNRGREAEIVGQQQCDHHRDEAGDRADRKVDAASDDSEGLADRQDRNHGALTQEVGHIVGRPEGRGLERKSDPHDEEQAEQGEAEKHVQPAAA